MKYKPREQTGTRFVLRLWDFLFAFYKLIVADCCLCHAAFVKVHEVSLCLAVYAIWWCKRIFEGCHEVLSLICLLHDFWVWPYMLLIGITNGLLKSVFLVDKNNCCNYYPRIKHIPALNRWISFSLLHRSTWRIWQKIHSGQKQKKINWKNLVSLISCNRPLLQKA